MKKNYQVPTKKLLATLALATSLFSGIAIAQPGANDPTFNTPDSGPNSVKRGSNGTITASAIQSNNNKIVVVGTFTQYNGAATNRIVRLNANGDTDAGFVTGTGLNQIANAVVIQSNNRVVVGGNFTSYNGTTSNRIVRLLTTGAIDNSFAIGTGFDNEVTAVLLQPDGKTVVAGKFTHFNGTVVNHVVRLKTNGTLDNTFTSNGATTPQEIALQADGKVLLAYAGLEQVTVKRLNSNGTTDTSYNAVIPIQDPNGIETYFPTAYSLLAQADGKVLVGGSFFFGNSPPIGFLKRANADGSVDTSFHFSNNAVTVYSLNLQSDGKVLAGGRNNLSPNGLLWTSNFLVRLNSNGSIDNSLLHSSVEQGANYAVQTTTIQNDGKIIVAGFFPEFNTYAAPNITRLNTDGTLDVTFNKVSAANGAITASAVQSNGRMVIGGTFSAYHFQSRNHIARIRENGTLDNSFNPGTGTNGAVTAVAVLPNGKIVIAGKFTTYNNQSAPGIVRVNSDGSIDASFNAGTGADGVILSLNAQSNNKIIITGDFENVNGTSRVGVARLNINGSVDAGFTSPITASFTNHVYTSFNLPSGKILVGGYFTATSLSSSRSNFVKLNSDGTLDLSFNSPAVYVHSIALQADGRIVVGSGLEQVGHDSGFGLVERFFSNGTRDNGFSGGTSPGETFPIYALTVLGNGNILAAGHFTGYAGNSLQNIMLLDTAGVVDPSFIGTADGTIYRTHLNADGSVIIAGAFNQYAGIARNGIARITFTSPSPYSARKQDITAITEKAASFSIYPNPATDAVNFDNLTIGSTITIRNIVGSVVHEEQVNNSKSTLSLSGYSNGVYFISQTANGKTNVQKFVVANN